MGVGTKPGKYSLYWECKHGKSSPTPVFWWPYQKEHFRSKMLKLKPELWKHEISSSNLWLFASKSKFRDAYCFKQRSSEVGEIKIEIELRYHQLWYTVHSCPSLFVS